jgi:hypothetical protein
MVQRKLKKLVVPPGCRCKKIFITFVSQGVTHKVAVGLRLSTRCPIHKEMAVKRMKARKTARKTIRKKR